MKKKQKKNTEEPSYLYTTPTTNWPFAKKQRNI
jgi:hypothetical protein